MKPATELCLNKIFQFGKSWGYKKNKRVYTKKTQNELQN